MSTRHLVAGMGEVGQAVATVLNRRHRVSTRDIPDVRIDADVLHVCFPWSDGFVGTVQRYVEEHGADLVIVHSTVPVGTCDAHGWVHSPIRGRHPHLEEGVATFVKHFGGVRAGEAAEYWRVMGLPYAVHECAAATEAGKLWELIQFGLQVRVEKSIYAWCIRYGLDPDVVYRQFADTYNRGYYTLGEHWALRPVLEHVPGPIGGHCVTQNAALIDHPISEVVQEGWS